MRTVGLCSGLVGSGLAPAIESRGSTWDHWGDDPVAPGAPVSLPAIRGQSARSITARLRAFLGLLENLQSRAEREHAPWASRVGVLRYILQTYVIGGIPLQTTATLRRATSGDDYAHEQIAHRRAGVSLFAPYRPVNPPPPPPSSRLQDQEEAALEREIQAAVGTRGNAGILRRLHVYSRVAAIANRRVQTGATSLSPASVLRDLVTGLHVYVIRGQPYDF